MHPQRYASNQFPVPIRVKPTLGNLLLDNLTVEFSKPFAVLQMLKKNNYSHIYPKTRLKIVSVKS